MMENTNWRSSSRNQQTIYLGRSFSENPYDRFLTGQKGTKETRRSSKIQGLWRKLRRKFRKEKKTFGSGRHSNPVIVPYNSYTYSQNFDDQGFSMAEPDNLSRSFSSRFAGSSSMMFSRDSVCKMNLLEIS